MTEEYEKHKKMLSYRLSKANAFNAEKIVEGIEIMIDMRVSEILVELSKRMEKK